MKAMKVIRNLLVIVGLMAVAGQAYAWGAPATEYHHARYALQNDIGEGWMGTVRLVHCDTPVPRHLERVKVDRSRGIVTYRCA